MKIFLTSLFAIISALLFCGTIPLEKSSNEKKMTYIDGEISIYVQEKQLQVKLSYSYVAQDNTRTKASLFLTSDVKIHTIEGSNIKSFEFDSEAKPFSTLTINFDKPLKKGEKTDFTISYSGKPSKGFWSDEHQWIDIDPDFMVLPIFTSLEDFTYHLYASIDDKNYTFYDLDKAQLSEDYDFTSSRASYYFNPIVAGNNGGNGMVLSRVRQNGYKVNIFSNKKDSVQYVSEAAGRVFAFFNTTFGKKDTINSFSVLYRPLPYSLHRITRSFNRSVIFARSHSNTSVLAHEIAHFWWNRGDALTTEKWLSESFAEYAKLMFIRHDEGEEKFKEIISDLAAKSEKLPPLLGNDRFSPQGNSLIYEKGPFLLYQLEKIIGREKFVAFLVELNQEKVYTTKELLLNLEESTSIQVRKEFEKVLNK